MIQSENVPNIMASKKRKEGVPKLKENWLVGIFQQCKEATRVILSSVWEAIQCQGLFPGNCTQ